MYGFTVPSDGGGGAADVGRARGVQYYVMSWWRNWMGIQYLSMEGAVLSTQSS